MKIEPSSDHRQIAAFAWQAQTAFTEVGFSTDQAFQLTQLWFKQMTNMEHQ